MTEPTNGAQHPDAPAPASNAPAPASNAPAPASKALWGGRFQTGPSPELQALSVSTHFDFRLAGYDLLQTRSHARVLHQAGLLSDAELAEVDGAIATVGQAVRDGSLVPGPDDEDVHTVVEQALIAALGATGGKIRAGRSRNDQIATDLRLFLRDHARGLAAVTLDLCDAIVEQARSHQATPAPGFTHLQHAQPVTLGHELAKHAHALLRDVDRLRDWDARAAVCPLGSGALSGSSLGLDPQRVARELGFDRPAANSIDAVSDRDFAAEFLFVCAMIGVHLSRLGEEVCLWVSQEFAWARLHDSWSTGSSIMPQKKNPDIAELARGKSGRLIGNLVALLTTLKGLAFAYNRDLQEDKEPVFDSLDTLTLVLPAMTGMVATLEFDPAAVSAGAASGHSLATEIADWLVRAQVPFRDAHEVAGQAVQLAESSGVELWELPAADLLALHPQLTEAVYDVLTVEGALAARTTSAGTGPQQVSEQVAALAETVTTDRAWAQAGVIPDRPTWL